MRGRVELPGPSGLRSEGSAVKLGLVDEGIRSTLEARQMEQCGCPQCLTNTVVDALSVETVEVGPSGLTSAEDPSDSLRGR
jgi:hypothetical protein